MSDTGAFRALARYLDRHTLDRCTVHERCTLRAGHSGPPRQGLSSPGGNIVLDPGEGR